MQINQKKYKKVLAKMRTLCYTVFRQRECWNWQTGKTKDLVGVCSCGFKSHLPHDAEVAELADAHGSGPCGSNTVRVQVPSSA